MPEHIVNILENLFSGINLPMQNLSTMFIAWKIKAIMYQVSTSYNPQRCQDSQ